MYVLIMEVRPPTSNVRSFFILIYIFYKADGEYIIFRLPVSFDQLRTQIQTVKSDSASVASRGAKT